MVKHSKERFLKAINREEPDIVPVTDLSMSLPIVEKITGQKSGGYYFQGISGIDVWEACVKNCLGLVKAHKIVGFDAVFISSTALVHKKYKPTYVDVNKFIDEWGMIRVNRKDSELAWWIGGTVNSEEDLEKYEPPSANEEGRFEILQNVVKEVNDELGVVGAITGLFTVAWGVRGGIDKLIIDMYAKPSFARKLIEKIQKEQLEWIKMMLDAKVDMIAYCDDYADCKSPLISPKLFNNFILPHLKQAINEVRKRGIKFLLHSDGNIYPILDSIINAGIDGIHPLEPGAMDIGDVKERYGDKVFVMGNVDCRYILPYGSEDDVRMDVRRVIDAAGYEGGLVMTSSNSLHPAVKVENIYTMVDEARKYGKYPIQRKVSSKHI
jgi:uroporphyrinogen decarboxylase